MVEQAGAARLREEVGAEADQRPRRDHVVESDPAGSVVGHPLHTTLALAEELRDGADVLLRNVDGQALGRLVQLAADLAGDHSGLAERELEALAAHHLHENGELQLAPALYLPGVGAVGW